MIEDAELLRRYAAEGSEKAFAELVNRHLGLVYSVALRQVCGDAHLAEDVTQRVFGALARKAAALAAHPVLTGWLYRTAHFTATDVLRSELRRRAREQEAQTMQDILTTNPEPAVDPERLRPVLDEVMGELGDCDRDALMLRFFEGRPFAEVGRRLQLTEDAARMRVERALEKMHRLLARRGMTSTALMLGTALAGQAAVPTSAGLAASVTGAVLTGTTIAGGFAGAGIVAATFMSIGKLQLGIAGAVIVASAGGLVWQQRANATLRQEIAGFTSQSGQLPEMRRENQRLEETATEVEAYRRDAADIGRLRNEAGALVERLRTAARAPAITAGDLAKGRVSTVAGSPATVYDLEQIDVKPVLISPSARPAYPFDLRRAGIAGQTLISFVVDAAGNTQEVKAINATHPDFANEAVAAVRKMRFSAGEKAGVPVNVQTLMPIKFTLSGELEQPAWFGSSP
jgi:RNA polymerase sigma factor (sigma-70 family)